MDYEFTGSNGANLIKKAVNLGAGTAVGFQNTISCGLDNQWVESFMSRIKAVYTISQTCSYLDSISPFAGTSLVSNVISGDVNLSLN